MWKVCIARRISPARNFDAFYLFTIKFSKSPARNFQTFQSGSGEHVMTFHRQFTIFFYNFFYNFIEVAHVYRLFTKVKSNKVIVISI